MEVGTKNLQFGLIRPENRFPPVECPLLLFLGPSKSLLIIGVLLVVVYLQQLNHEGLIHTVPSEQLMLRCVCYLNSVKRLFGLQFLRLVTLMNLSSAAEVNLGLPFLWWSS